MLGNRGAMYCEPPLNGIYADHIFDKGNVVSCVIRLQADHLKIEERLENLLLKQMK